MRVRGISGRRKFHLISALTPDLLLTETGVSGGLASSVPQSPRGARFFSHESDPDQNLIRRECPPLTLGDPKLSARRADDPNFSLRFSITRSAAAMRRRQVI